MILRILKSLFGGGATAGVAGTVRGIAGVFRPHAENQDRRLSDEATALYQAYGREFHRPTNWFDSLVNGLNRLPRPAIIAGIFYLFHLSIDDPQQFTLIMTAWASIPEFLGIAVVAVVSFYFSFRPFEKRMAARVDLERVRAGAQAVADLKRQIGEERRAAAPVDVRAGTPDVLENEDEDEPDATEDPNPPADRLARK